MKKGVLVGLSLGGDLAIGVTQGGNLWGEVPVRIILPKEMMGKENIPLDDLDGIGFEAENDRDTVKQNYRAIIRFIASGTGRMPE